jgi:hypothetical protein
MIDEFEAFELLNSDFYPEFLQIKETLIDIFNNIKSKNPELNNAKITFEDCFNETNEDGMIYARCHDLKNQIIDINLYPIAMMLDENNSVNDIINFYIDNEIIKHECAHLIDYQINGDKDLINQHDSKFTECLNTIKENKKMKKDKFTLLFEDIMDALHEAEVDYTIFNDYAYDIVKNEILKTLNITEEEFQSYGDFIVEVADESDIIDHYSAGLHTPENDEEAERLKDKVILINFESFAVDDDQLNLLVDNMDFIGNILVELNKYNNNQFEDIIFDV